MHIQNNWIIGVLYAFIFHVNGFINIKENEGIAVGIITDHNTEQIRKTFEYAINVANTELGVPLIGYNEEIKFGDSIEGYTKICKFMQNGIGAIFGPSSRQTSAHLLTVCDAKDVPYMYPHMSDHVEGFNLYPNPLDLARILHNVIDLFKWTRFIFLYESSDYLSILNGLMSFYISDGPLINVLRYDLKLNGNYKAVLRRVRKSEDGQIVVVGSTPSVAELLRQAQQVGIMNDKYSYIIGNLDLQTFDLEEYKYSEANITGFRMFSPTQSIVQDLISHLDYSGSINDRIINDSCPITLEMALTYDAVQVFAATTKKIMYRPQALNCSDQSSQVQTDGSTFKNYMRSTNIEEKTITGPVYFDGNIRKGYTLDIVELQTTGLVKIGTWDERNNLTIQRPPQSKLWSEVDANSLVNQTFRVLISVPNKPYASLVESHKKLVGNNQYEGYSIDLIKELSAKLGFNYILINGGSNYGNFNKTTNKTTGMMKEINEGRAELAITDLTITSEREEIIDFSIPFMNLDWPYRDKLNNALLELQEQGVLAQLKNKWWNVVGAGVCKKKSDSQVASLDLKSLGGVYLVLGVGSGLSLIYGLIMWCIYVARKANYYEVPFGAAFLEELRIAINVANNERILKSAQSVYSRSRNSLLSIDSIDTDSEVEKSSKTDEESENTY
ncbi:glutamate receptor ionotropic, kainate 2 isoform X2 [Zeugodacus cucurbitae]|uniref:glutamate receptor ionotropic, kainate 2 isoform X2 n=1 Tax=Zeugodacus cucurbitae TaxID=28588 RepID=UPI0023D90114|nr:glutamate receptor ionotropic, kainate 2 isoform X2 [Zeugodacus cucurbitae]